MRCAGCGFENPEGNRFFSGCGSALLASPAPEEREPLDEGNRRFQVERLKREGAS